MGALAMPLLQLLKRFYLQAATVAIVVGTILLIINQHDALFGTRDIQWVPALLTYCVPFCVFMFGKRSSDQIRRKTSGFDVPVSR